MKPTYCVFLHRKSKMVEPWTLWSAYRLRERIMMFRRAIANLANCTLFPNSNHLFRSNFIKEIEILKMLLGQRETYNLRPRK